MYKRRIEAQIIKDLTKKMVFISGPRQCGKTTLVREALASEMAGIGEYMNWDIARDRRKIQNQEFSLNAKTWAFDEIHKFRKWRNFLKGVYDEHHKEHQILVTGSGRLEHYGRGGDSLQGRYYLHHLHPFTASEVLGLPFNGASDLWELPRAEPKGAKEAIQAMLELGGFPEPFLSSSTKEAARWRLQYGERLVQEEVRTLENLRDLDQLELLFERLGAVAGSVVSINSLREDADAAFKTVKHWLAILERLDAIFRISPYGPPKIKAVKKEQKLYFWDSARAESAGAKFENLIAVHLMRFVHWMQDVEGESWDLRFFKHREGHEVDFILMKQRKPVLAIEVKSNDQALSPSVRYMLERNLVPMAYQVVLQPGVDKRSANLKELPVRMISAGRLLANLP